MEHSLLPNVMLSGLVLSFRATSASCHSDPSQSEGEESHGAQGRLRRRISVLVEGSGIARLHFLTGIASSLMLLAMTAISNYWPWDIVLGYT
ncbi:MAG: hypothetical protein KAT75_12200 [Dehalococcoidia bacterium]|nr:hypothetical protein [Dehalococcoidia bacterium]